MAVKTSNWSPMWLPIMSVIHLNASKMTSCGLCRKGERENFVALSDDTEHVKCTNPSCGYVCSAEDLQDYERAVQ